LRTGDAAGCRCSWCVFLLAFCNHNRLCVLGGATTTCCVRTISRVSNIATPSILFRVACLWAWCSPGRRGSSWGWGWAGTVAAPGEAPVQDVFFGGNGGMGMAGAMVVLMLFMLMNFSTCRTWAWARGDWFGFVGGGARVCDRGHEIWGELLRGSLGACEL
jgi:hypothetical protein